MNKEEDNDNNDDNDDNDGNGLRPPRTAPPPPYDFPLCNTPLLSPLISDDDKIEWTPVAREKVAIAEKVKFSEKLSNVFSDANEILNKNDYQKSLSDEAESLSKPDEMTIFQAQVIYKDLNKGKLPEQLRFFTDGNSGINKLRIHATNKLKSELNKSNKAFLDYLISDYVHEILAKKQNKNTFGYWKHLSWQYRLEREHLWFFTHAAKWSKKTCRIWN